LITGLLDYWVRATVEPAAIITETIPFQIGLMDLVHIQVTGFMHRIEYSAHATVFTFVVLLPACILSVADNAITLTIMARS